MAAMADEDDVPARRDEPLGLAMDLGDERAGGVEIIEPARLGVGGHRFGHAVRRKPHRRAVGHLVQFLDEHRALGFQAVDHELRSEEHTSELQSLMRISYAVVCLKKNIEN